MVKWVGIDGIDNGWENIDFSGCIWAASVGRMYTPVSEGRTQLMEQRKRIPAAAGSVAERSCVVASMTESFVLSLPLWIVGSVVRCFADFDLDVHPAARWETSNSTTQ